MEKYYATILYYASEPLVVKAESPEAAADEAYANSAATLCHYCSNHLELNDSYGIVITNEDGDEVYTDQPPTIMPEALTTAQRRIAQLEKELQAVVDLHTTAQQLQTAAAIRAVLGVVADDARAALQEPTE